MASRMFFRGTISTIEPELVILCGRVSIGATGAPTIPDKGFKGIASIARQGAGDYLVTLQDKYVRLYDVSALIVDDAAPSSYSPYLKADSVSADTPTFRIAFLDAAGAEAELPNGAELRLTLLLKNSKVGE